LSDYGFVKPGNEKNSERMHFTGESKIVQRKRFIFGTDYALLQLHVVGVQVMRFYRIYLANWDTMHEAHIPRSWSNEHDVAKSCFDTMNEEINSKSTQIGEDYVLLQTAKGRLQTAIIYRIEQKKVYMKTRSFCIKVTDSILPCIASDTVRKPKYFKMLSEVSRSA
jgi:hypothetical protein